jgi:2-polyprenyl-6-hydroxyphenyl methylase/3-demethylubiquinone-9 3-methyltransferase
LEAQSSVQALLGVESLAGKTFLDIGSGSGLFSLVARKMGAGVHSFDYDARSVQSTALLRDRYFPDDPEWVVERGSVLDAEYLRSLGHYDVVYSWGVLHHTGGMDEAIRNASERVSPGGLFVFALYRKTALCWAWTIEKRWYARATPEAQARAMKAYIGLARLGFRLQGRDLDTHIREYFQKRGMDYQRDIHDWLGGYPYESIRPQRVERLMTELGFTQVQSRTRPYSIGLFGSGCDEYAYRRGPSAA